jgi:hypothetical protein
MNQGFMDGNGQHRQLKNQGFALAAVLVFLVVLSIAGSAVYRNVSTDIIHSGKDLKRVRAEYAAESSVQWALAELALTRGSVLPFTLATHASDGNTRLYPGTPPMLAGVKAMKLSDLDEAPGAKLGVDENGWIYSLTTSEEAGTSGGANERLSFKVWYPDDSTVCIKGRGSVDGSQADLDLVSKLTEVATRK